MSIMNALSVALIVLIVGAGLALFFGMRSVSTAQAAATPLAVAQTLSEGQIDAS